MFKYNNFLNLKQCIFKNTIIQITFLQQRYLITAWIPNHYLPEMFIHKLTHTVIIDSFFSIKV